MAAGGLLFAGISAVRRKPSADAVAYWGLVLAFHSQKEQTLRWPEYPGGEFRLFEPDPHYRRPWHVPPKKAADVPWRTVFLGDSHVCGVTRNRENFTAILDRDSSPAQVINCGVFGWGPLDALRHFRTELDGYDFDQVYFVSYLGNDLSDLYRHGEWQAEKVAGGGYREVRVPPLDPPGAIQRAMQDLGFSPEDHVAGPERRALLFRRVWLDNPGCIEQSLWQALFFRDSPEKLPEAVGAFRDTMRMMNEIARKRGQRFTLVLLPTKTMVEPELANPIVESGARLIHLPPEFVHFDERVRGLLLEATRGEPYDTLDLTEPLREARRRNPGRPLYWRADFHLSLWGHRALAGFFRDRIRPADRTTTASR